jgi:hypothetical protein
LETAKREEEGLNFFLVAGGGATSSLSLEREEFENALF